MSSLNTEGSLTTNRRGWGFTLNSTTVLSIYAVGTDRPLGTLVNFGAHPTTLGRSVLSLSSDFGGYLCRHIEEATGGAPAMWMNAALGDVVPVAPGHGFDRAQSYGIAVGNAALAAAANGVDIGSSLRIAVERYEEQITNPAFAAALLLGVLDEYYEVSSGGIPGQLAVPTMAARLHLGLHSSRQLIAVTTPGEALTRNAAPVVDMIEKTYPDAVSMVFGLLHDSLGYYVPEDEWETGRNGDYEESVAPSRFAGEHLRDRLMHLVTPNRAQDSKGRPD
eukprot:SAG31_NODE_12630_length_928_cov_1.301568_1_plen_277_part_10